jgi:hypothetical protein
VTDSSDIAARAREALADPNNLDLALNPEPLARSLLAALETAETRAAEAEYGERTYRTVREERDMAIAERDELRAHFPHAARVLYRAGRIISGTEAAPEDPYHLVNDLVDLAELFEKAGGVS